MALSPEFKSFVEDLFAPAFSVRIRRMFGGAGIYSGEVMFGLISDERIYLKTDDMTRPDFEAEGSAPFTFQQKSGDFVAMSYMELPERLYDEPDELRDWAMKALSVALKGKTAARKAKAATSTKKVAPKARRKAKR